MSAKYGVCIKTLQCHLDKFWIEPTVKKSRSVVVLMDTTYWGRNFGVMLFKDAYTGENLLEYYVKTETTELYKKGIGALLEAIYDIEGLFCDSRKGLVHPSELSLFKCVSFTKRQLFVGTSPKIQKRKQLLNSKNLSNFLLTDVTHLNTWRLLDRSYRAIFIGLLLLQTVSPDGAKYFTHMGPIGAYCL